jgi:hypothetical protein
MPSQPVTIIHTSEFFYKWFQTKKKQQKGKSKNLHINDFVAALRLNSKESQT